MIPFDIKQYISKAIELIAQYETAHKNSSSSANSSLNDIKSKIITTDKLWETINNVPNDSAFRNTINRFISLMSNFQQTNSNLDSHTGELNQIQTELGSFISYLVVDLNSIESLINKASQSLGIRINSIENQFNKQMKEALELMPKVKEKLNTIDEEANKLIEKKAEIQEQLQTQSFNLQNKILSAVFDKKREELIKERKYYLYPAVFTSFILGCGYIIFFICQFSKDSFNYFNHLMLIGVCSPFIFLAVWLFYQAARVTRLSEIYAYKATLGFTIEDAIAQINKYDDTKENSSKVLNELLMRLYEVPVNHKDEKNIVVQNITELTDLMKEIRNLIDSLKSSYNKSV